MSLPMPPLAKVSSGDPITSERWNNIIDALTALYGAFNKVLGGLEVTVADTGGNALPGAVVSVVPSDPAQGPPRVASFVGDDVDRYRVDQLAAGAYKVTVEAAGYHTETASITMAADGSSQTLAVQMKPTEALAAVPVLLGRVLNEAVSLLGTDLQIARIIDSHGNDIPPGAITDTAAKGLVLNQVPMAGSLVPKNTAIFLLISAPAEFTQRVQVPDIRGLTLDQARVALEASQLVLGETKNA
jgi:hypothetical protein